ncbi:PREDICTED: transmembrane protein 177, partial [Hipposideros armiger]|uniref:Transmembrane protein 177 n=1 Tax=Hipposideros armiger TaxID=186990 RepID=A0A8B7Q9Y1_HIPAR
MGSKGGSATGRLTTHAGPPVPRVKQERLCSGPACFAPGPAPSAGLACVSLGTAQRTCHGVPGCGCGGDPVLRWLYQYWPQGQPAPLSPKLQRLFQEVLQDMGLPSDHCYKAFTTFTFQPVSAGFPRLPAGAVVGIPASFLGDTVTNTNRPVVIHGQRVDWQSPAGTRLKDALTLSHDAQKFAVAREVVYLE